MALFRRSRLVSPVAAADWYPATRRSRLVSPVAAADWYLLPLDAADWYPTTCRSRLVSHVAAADWYPATRRSRLVSCHCIRLSYYTTLLYKILKVGLIPFGIQMG